MPKDTEQSISNKRIAMPQQQATQRVTNFNEVNLGLSAQMAKAEAGRCIQCKKPKCVEGCPVFVKIPQFIKAVADGNYANAAEIIKQDNVLPAVCGRVCPQEKQCEKLCVLGVKSEPVAIGYLERFAADTAANYSQLDDKNTKKHEEVDIVASEYHKNVAIVGSGPAGLSCAGDLIAMGHNVTVFEALHDIGGVLLYGIPEFRLPKDIVKYEVAALAKAGVKFVKNYVIGFTETIDELLSRFDAVFVAVGAGLPYFLNIPGELLIGVYTSNEFLTRVNLMKAYKFPQYDTPVMDFTDKTVAVFGGGNTAMDAVRTSARLGAKRAIIMYRRTEVEMPARLEEVHHAKEEGIEFMTLVAPLEFLGNENGHLQSVVIQRMELGEQDASGRRQPIPIPNAIETIAIDSAIIAIGNGSNTLVNNSTPDVKVNKWGNIIVNSDTMETSKQRVFAGGDVVTGGATVIQAMGAGRTAAKAINQLLANK